MELATEIFLTSSEQDRFNLFKIIKEHLNRVYVFTREAGDLSDNSAKNFSAVNLKEVAKNIDRNYGAIYNSYTQMIDDFRVILGTEHPTENEIFNYEADLYLYYLSKNSLSYKFIEHSLLNDDISLEQFLEKNEVSKATAMRHFRPLRLYLKKYGVRMSYNKLGFVGDEHMIRLALTGLLWATTNGNVWPFTVLDHEEISELFAKIVQEFGFTEINQATSELFKYSIAVKLMRLNGGHTLENYRSLKFISLPFEPVFYEFIANSKDPFLKAIPEFDDTAEVLGLYLTLNMLPFNHENMSSIDFLLKSFKHYASNIYQFVDAFMSELPGELVNHFNLSIIEKKALRLNLMRVTLGVLATKEKYPVILNDFYGMDSFFAVDEDSHIHQDIETAMERVESYQSEVVVTKDLETLKAAYFQILRRLSTYMRSSTHVNVAINAAANTASYMDLNNFLRNFEFVNLQRFNEIDETTDVIVSGTSSVNYAMEQAPNAIVCRVDSPINSSDLGVVTVLLVRMWRSKVLKNNGGNVDGIDIELSNK